MRGFKVYLMVIFVFALSVYVSACSCKQGQSTWDCLKENVGAIAEQVCGFNTNDSQVAQDGINFISAVAPLVGKVFGVSVTDQQAKATLTKVVDLAAKGGCLAATDLQQALAFVDKLTDQYNQLVNTKSLKLRGLKKLPEPTDMTVLRHKARL